MLAELDVVVYLKSGDNAERTAARVFGTLKSDFRVAASEEADGEQGMQYFEASGLGFNAVLYANTGDIHDPEFADFQFGLEITSQFWCVDLDTIDLEGPLSEYFARKLAFDLNIETATEILLDTTEEAEIFEIRSFRRNPQYRLDQSPTTPKVFVVESRQVEEPFDDEDEFEDEEDLEDVEDEDER